MTIVYVLAPLSLLLAATFVFAFFRAVESDQFSDLETPAVRALFDGPPPKELKGTDHESA